MKLKILVGTMTSTADYVAQAIQMMIGGMDVGVFKEAGRRHDIRMRLEDADRRDPAQIGNLYVRGRSGEPIELRNLVDIQTGAAPSDSRSATTSRRTACSRPTRLAGDVSRRSSASGRSGTCLAPSS